MESERFDLDFDLGELCLVDRGLERLRLPRIKMSDEQRVRLGILRARVRGAIRVAREMRRARAAEAVAVHVLADAPLDDVVAELEAAHEEASQLVGYDRWMAHGLCAGYRYGNFTLELAAALRASLKSLRETRVARDALQS